MNDKINFLCDNIYSSDKFIKLINVKIIDADIFVDFIYVIGQFLNNNISVAIDDDKIKTKHENVNREKAKSRI